MEVFASPTDRIASLIKLTGNVFSSIHEHLWGGDDVPEELQTLVHELQSLGRVLAGLRNHLGNNEFSAAVLEKLNIPNGPLFETAAELKKLQLRFSSDKRHGTDSGGFTWLSDKEQITPYTSVMKKHKDVLVLAIQLMKDQSKLSEVMSGYGQSGNLATNKLKSKPSVEYAKARAIQEAAKRKTDLDWLWSGDFETRFLDLQERRLAGTGEWLLQSPIFQNWKKGKPGCRILWGHAIAGAGKTYMSSKVIDHIRSAMPQSNEAVAYIFFDHMARDQHAPKDVLCCLLKQIACQIRPFPQPLLYLRLKEKQSEPTVAKLWTNIIEMSQSFDRFFLVLDGLDECDQTEHRKELLRLFDKLSTENISVLITSRSQAADVRASLHSVPQLDLSARDEDLRILIGKKIDDNLRARRLLERGQSRERFMVELTAIADGMFLFVYLLAGSLLQLPTVKSIFISLAKFKQLCNIEDRLDLAYDEIFDAIRHQNKVCKGIALNILNWVVNAKRSLLLGELREAVAVEEKRYELKETDLLDGETILQICRGLVNICNSTGTTQLIHPSARDRILKSQTLLLPDGDYQLAMLCITYLSFDCLSHIAAGRWVRDPENPYMEFRERLRLFPFFEYAAKYLAAHIKACDFSLTKDLFLEFTKRPGQMATYWEFHQDDIEYRVNDDLPLASPLNVSAFVGHLPALRHLVSSGGYRSDNGGRTVLHAAVKGNNLNVVEFLLGNGQATRHQTGLESTKDLLESPYIHNAGDDSKPPLQLAARRGYMDLVKLLLESGVDINDGGEGGQSALHEAVRGCHEPIVSMLLQNGASAWNRDESGQTALHIAAQEGHEAISKQLLEHKDKIRDGVWKHGWERTLVVIQHADDNVCEKRNIDLGVGVSALDRHLQTPLHLAALGGHEGIARFLVQNGADVCLQDTSGETPLHEAARGGAKCIVQLLLQHQSDVYEKTHFHVTALQRAATRGYTEIVEVLRDHGADKFVNMSDSNSPLSISLSSGYTSLVNLFLEKNKRLSHARANSAISNAASKGFCDLAKTLFSNGANISSGLLYKAAANGHTQMVKFLLDHGADISSRHNNSESALHTAADGGHEDVVRLLLEKGGDVLSEDQNGQTPLHRAVVAVCKNNSSMPPTRVGNEEIVQLLLEYGASISAQDHENQTALILAAAGGRKEVVEILVVNGSDVRSHNLGGNTALHMAAGSGHAEIVKFLLSHGAAISDQNLDNQTPVMLAVRGGHAEVVRLLIKNGVNIAELYNGREKALVTAVARGYDEVVEAILENGGNVFEENSEGETLFLIAVREGRGQVVEVILKHGGDISGKDKEGRSALFTAVSGGLCCCCFLITCICPSRDMALNYRTPTN